MPAPHRPQVIPAILAKEELQDSSIPSNARILAALLQPWEFWDCQNTGNIPFLVFLGFLVIPEFWRIQHLTRVVTRKRR